MFGLEKLARAFDEIHKSNVDAMREGIDAVWVARGDSVGVKIASAPVAIPLEIAAAAYGLLGLHAKGLVDLARLGESVGNFTLGAVVQDVVRVLGLAGPALKLFQVSGIAMRVAVGGLNSCASSGAAKALAQSGQMPLVWLNFRSIVRRLGGAAKVINKEYAGMTLFETSEQLRLLGGRHRMATVESFAELDQFVAKAEGPVLFSWDGHAITGFKTLRGIRYADQYARVATSPVHLGPPNLPVTTGAITGIDPVHLDFRFVNTVIVVKSAAPTWITAGAVAQFEVMPLIDGVLMSAGQVKAIRDDLMQQVQPKVSARQTKTDGFGQFFNSETSWQPNSDSPSVTKSARWYITTVGDSLASVAKKAYGDPKQANRIFQANAGVAGVNPAGIVAPGIRLRIP